VKKVENCPKKPEKMVKKVRVMKNEVEKKVKY